MGTHLPLKSHGLVLGVVLTKGGKMTKYFTIRENIKSSITPFFA